MEINNIEDATAARPSFFDYHDNTYNVISKVAYLIGVKKEIFENANTPPEIDVYNALELNKNARIIRNLCMLRTALEKNYKAVYDAMRYNLKNLHTLPDLIPTESLDRLYYDGISIEKANANPAYYIKEINKIIKDRINNIKDIFPVWLVWDYVKDLFIMPDGLTDSGIKAAASEYYANKNAYPYQVYINWPGTKPGNILYSDEKFVKLLYEVHRDVFDDISKVTDAGVRTKNEIYDFLDGADKVAIVVDCENSDPYKIYAMLNNLNQEALLDRICKIILYDDIHTSSAWNVLDSFTQIPVEYILVDRVKEQKSLVDIRLTAGVCKEHYENNTDAIILASSDSDFWGLISALPQVKFYVLVESEKCGPNIKQTLDDKGYSYCYIDNFCTGNSDKIKMHVLLDYFRDTLDANVNLNVKDIMREALEDTRANLSEAEKKQFYERYIKPMKLVIDSKTGDVKIELGK